MFFIYSDVEMTSPVLLVLQNRSLNLPWHIRFLVSCFVIVVVAVLIPFSSIRQAFNLVPCLGAWFGCLDLVVVSIRQMWLWFVTCGSVVDAMYWLVVTCWALVVVSKLLWLRLGLVAVLNMMVMICWIDIGIWSRNRARYIVEWLVRIFISWVFAVIIIHFFLCYDVIDTTVIQVIAGC